MGRIDISAVAEVPVDVAFAYVDDYRTVPEWMFGVAEFEPLGTQENGIGASYAAAMRLGPKTLHSKVRVTEWEQDRLITLTSYEGVENASSWRFRKVDDEHTELTVVFQYDLGSGVAGRALTKAVEPFIQKAIEQTEKDLRRQTEKHYARLQRGER